MTSAAGGMWSRRSAGSCQRARYGHDPVWAPRGSRGSTTRRAASSPRTPPDGSGRRARTMAEQARTIRTPARMVEAALRRSDGYIPALSLVALGSTDSVVGHVLIRGHVASVPALGLGRISVRPDQKQIGLMHAVLGAAERSMSRWWRCSAIPFLRPVRLPADTRIRITAPDRLGHRIFQVRILPAYRPSTRGQFTPPNRSADSEATKGGPDHHRAPPMQAQPHDLPPVVHRAHRAFLGRG